MKQTIKKSDIDNFFNKNNYSKKMNLSITKIKDTYENVLTLGLGQTFLINNLNPISIETHIQHEWNIYQNLEEQNLEEFMLNMFYFQIGDFISSIHQSNKDFHQLSYSYSFFRNNIELLINELNKESPVFIVLHKWENSFDSLDYEKKLIDNLKHFYNDFEKIKYSAYKKNIYKSDIFEYMHKKALVFDFSLNRRYFNSKYDMNISDDKILNILRPQIHYLFYLILHEKSFFCWENVNNNDALYSNYNLREETVLRLMKTTFAEITNNFAQELRSAYLFKNLNENKQIKTTKKKI